MFLSVLIAETWIVWTSITLLITELAYTDSYSSSSCWSLVSTSIFSCVVAFSSLSIVGGGISESVTWISSSLGLSWSKLNLSMSILSTSGLELRSYLVRASPNLTEGFSPLLAFVFLYVPQSNLHPSTLIPGVRDKGCGTDCLHDM